jgi:hypothetical protein
VPILGFDYALRLRISCRNFQVDTVVSPILPARTEVAPRAGAASRTRAPNPSHAGREQMRASR